MSVEDIGGFLVDADGAKEPLEVAVGKPSMMTLQTAVAAKGTYGLQVSIRGESIPTPVRILLCHTHACTHVGTRVAPRVS